MRSKIQIARIIASTLKMASGTKNRTDQTVREGAKTVIRTFQKLRFKTVLVRLNKTSIEKTSTAGSNSESRAKNSSCVDAEN